MHKEYEYTSCFAPLIASYISERRSAGFMYDTPAYWLYRFDQFCAVNKINETALSKDLYEKWSPRSDTESKTTQNSRLTALRCFSVYLNSIGIASYIPYVLPKPEKKVPYLMENEDIYAFFEQVDAYESFAPVASFDRLATEYKVLFRLLYCCGLRNNEACSLKSENVDTDTGIITVIHSKGNKDRVVYLPKDMQNLCRNYQKWLQSELGIYSEWFFPGKYPEKHIPKTSVDRKFNEFWNATEISKHSDKKPTVHCLRHAYVIKRMNDWMKNDIDLDIMMPYLSSYLGHSSPAETYYYYHQIQEAFETIRRKDKISSKVIPEVQHEKE